MASGSREDHRLQVLGAEDGPDAGAPGRPALVGLQAGETDHVLPRGTDHHGLGPRPAGHRLRPAFRLPTPQAPEPGGVAETHPILLDDQESGRLGPAGDDHRVVPGSLERDAGTPGGIGLGVQAGLGRFAEDTEAGAGGPGNHGQGTCGKDDHVLRGKGINQRGNFRC